MSLAMARFRWREVAGVIAAGLCGALVMAWLQTRTVAVVSTVRAAPSWSVEPGHRPAIGGPHEPGVWHVCQRRSWELRAEPPPCPFERARWRDLPWVRASYAGPDLDGWGNPLLMTCEWATHRWRVAVASAGPDGTLDTEDDVVVPCRALEYPEMQ